MIAKELIKQIREATSYVQVFSDLSDWNKAFQDISKIIHPDRCKEDGSKEAFQKLVEFKIELGTGKKFKDDAGVVNYRIRDVEFIGENTLLSKSYNCWKVLMNFKDKSSVHFQKYLPETGSVVDEGNYKYTFFRRAVPLVSLGVMKQEYVNFILSRMLEFTGWMNQVGYCHAGINPDSVFVIPEDHGMVCTSFYHMTKLGSKLSTVSGKYSHFYPANIFKDKIAESNIDIELSKRTAIYLLGDKSGTGNSLKKTHNPDFINFVQKEHYDPIECYKEYREMLSKNFDTKKFHILNV